MYLEKILHQHAIPVRRKGGRLMPYSTEPMASIVSFVSVFKGVEATTQTPPLESLIAVERPPIGNNPAKRVNGLHIIHVSVHRTQTMHRS